MILSKYIKKKEDVLLIETLRRTLLTVYGPFESEDPQSIEILERLWSLEASELFGEPEMIEQAKINRARQERRGRLIRQAKDPYDFDKALYAFQLGGYLNASLNMKILDISHFLEILTYYFGADHVKTFDILIEEIFYVCSRCHATLTGTSEEEASFYVRNLFTDHLKAIQKETR